MRYNFKKLTSSELIEFKVLLKKYIGYDKLDIIIEIIKKNKKN